ncbi:MAG: shikimate dehydrogenase [Ruegeria sp.]|nr:shikimate dehydrogenase [Ruegeria sp.]
MGKVDARTSATQGTLLAGLVGRGIQKSRTPAMHVAEGAAQGLRAIYRLLDVDEYSDPKPELGDIIRAAELLGFDGLNVTYPYKIDVMSHLDELSANASAVGAVNTVVFKNGRRIGHNTDLWGFAESFRRSMSGSNSERVLLIGAGGAGVAVAHALADSGVSTLLIFDRDAERASALAHQVSKTRPAATAVAVDSVEAAVRDGLNGVVNATPIGMEKSPGCAFPPDLLTPDYWVADIVYFPLETELLAAARAVGCPTLSGAGMAVFQAARAFELFTGIVPDPDRMKATFNAFNSSTPPKTGT